MTPRCLLLLSVLCCSGLAAQSVGDVLINEFCYDSDFNVGSLSGPDVEWVELYNTTGAAIDMSSWQLRDNTALVTLPSGSTIQANGYFVVALTASASQFLGYTGWPADYVNTQGWAGLANGGDGLALFTPSAALCIDYIQYGTGNAVPGAPAYTGTRAGDFNQADDFALARIPNGVNADATPGDAGSEAGATSFMCAPYTPGRANGGTMVDVIVPDEYSDHYSGGTPFQTLVPRSTSDPARMVLDLPPGFDFNTNSSFGFTNRPAVRARYHDGAATVTVSYAINSAETTISTANITLPAGGTMAVPINQDLPVLFGQISGQVPNSVGTIVVDITCAITAGATQTFKLQFDVDAPQITTSPGLADVFEAQTAQVSIAATGGATPYSWAVSNNPAWVSIGASSGQLTMTPPAGSAADYTFDVTVTDSNTPGRFHTVTFDVTVVGLLNITTTTLTTVAEGGTPVDTVAATGGTPAYTFSLNGAPAWLTINPATGVLGGTAPAASAGTYNFDLQVADAGSPMQTDSQPASLIVVDVLTITSPANITAGIEASNYNYTFTAVGGTTPYVWTATGLPTFLGLNPNSGLLSGIPTNSDAGTYNFDVTVTDFSTPTQSDMLSVTLVINPLGGGGGSGGSGGGGGGGCTAASGTALPLISMLLLALAARSRRRSSRS